MIRLHESQRRYAESECSACLADGRPAWHPGVVEIDVDSEGKVPKFCPGCLRAALAVSEARFNPSAFPRTGMSFLEGLGFGELIDWLNQALRGVEPLPVVSEETPEESILRFLPMLKPRTQQDVKEACLLLVHRFAYRTGGTCTEDDSVASMLRLGQRLLLPNPFAERLYDIVQNKAFFATLPVAQQKVVVCTLFDTCTPLPASFWVELASRDIHSFGVIAFSGLLRVDVGEALKLLSLIPNDEAVVDQIYVVLDAEPSTTESITRKVDLWSMIGGDTRG